MKNIIKIIIISSMLIFLLSISFIGVINLFVIFSTSSKQYSLEQFKENQTHQAKDVSILVLGAGIIDAQTPSKILAARLDAAIALAKQYPEKKLIMSGDHKDIYYDEVSVMKNYAISHGIASERIYLDHAGYSTYDSLYRLKSVLGQQRVIIVTQGYHLSRALMLASGLKLNAVGIQAQEVNSTRVERESREVLARIKDFMVTYGFYSPPEVEENFGFNLQQSGDLTNDKEQLLNKNEKN
ncbi:MULTISPECIES: YdcF family protein [unclassified Facklamia]|uniref:SanA/YdcF family protein n=1 Tax=Aerococcaceae TaxID=186827 RepID=UPI0013BA7941|nr:YdcF family protein [Aerococcaceae bacterium zg-B36]NEW64435.1 SanA protein [Facklamia sp. 252]NEW67642.1 SanA protein [Facklamia sp. 253]QQD65623.1 YdcF family protein [Aerococcaceae bacterium zg-252]